MELFPAIDLLGGKAVRLVQGDYAQKTVYSDRPEEVAEGFRVSARAAGGIVEAIERVSGAPMLGVQWHPECMEERYPVFRSLFSWLVKEAGRLEGENRIRR